MSTCNNNTTVSARRRAKQLNLYIEQGATFEIPIVYKEDDQPVNLTGATVRSQFREKINTAEPIFDLSIGSGLTLTPLEGKITLVITAAQTAALKVYKGVWDMLITFSDGTKFRILTGEFEVDRGVTR